MSIFDRFFQKKEDTRNVAFVSTYGNQTIVNPKNLLEQYEYWTFKAIKTKFDALNSLKYYTIDREGSELQDAQLTKDIEHFNSYIDFSQGLKIAIMHLSLTGACFLYVRPSMVKGYNYELVPLNPKNMEVIPDRTTGLPIAYEYNDANGRKQKFELEEIIRLYDPDPMNWVKAKGILEASSYFHNIVEFSLEYNNNLFGNMGSLKSILMLDHAEQHERDAFEQMFEEKFAGTRNAGKTGILADKVELLKMGESPRELDFANTLDKMRDSVLVMQGVPPDMIVGGATFSNASEAVRIFQEYTILPLTQQISSGINRVLAKKYAGDIRFTFENPVKKDIEKETARAEKLFKAGIITRNEALEIAGRPTLDGGLGDEYYPIGGTKASDIIDQMESLKDEVKQVREKSNQVLIETKEITRKEHYKNLQKELLKKQLEVEESVKPMLREFFTSQSERIVKNTKSIKTFVALDWEAENQTLYTTMEDITAIITEEYKRITGDLYPVSTALSERFMSMLEDQGLSRSKLINEVTKKEIQKIIADSALVDDGLDQVRSKLRDLFDNYTQHRVDTIAMSEVTRIKNGVRSDIFKQNKNIETEAWLNVGDSKVRESHQNVKPVKKGEKFKVGGELLRYPGDPSGSGENTIGCRCELIANDFGIF